MFLSWIFDNRQKIFLSLRKIKSKITIDNFFISIRLIIFYSIMLTLAFGYLYIINQSGNSNYCDPEESYCDDNYMGKKGTN